MNATTLENLRLTADDNAISAAAIGGDGGSALHQAVISGALAAIMRRTGTRVDSERCQQQFENGPGLRAADYAVRT